MSTTSTRNVTIFLGLAWVVLIIVLYCLASLSFVGIPGRDSSVYIYVAQGILQGDIPYVDRWDHKPPLIYLLDSMGLLIGGGNIAGIWFLESIILAGTIWIGAKVLKNNFGGTAAAFAIGLFLIYFYILAQRGNLTEEYVLFCQFLSLYLFSRTSSQHDQNLWFSVALGALAATAFLLKPNLIGLWVAIGLYWLFWGTNPLRRILYAIAGATLVFIVLFAVLASVNAWSSFLDAAFSYNFAFSGATPLSEKIKAVLLIVERVDVFPLVITGWAMGLGYVLLQKTRSEPYSALVLLAIIALPIELALIGTSGRSHKHYYLPALPVITILLGFFGKVISDGLSRFCAETTSVKNEITIKTLTTALLSTIVLGMAYLYRGDYVYTLRGIKEKMTHGVLMSGVQTQIAARVRSLTSPGEPVLIWGNQAQIYLLSKRQAPTRFFYQYPFVTPNYANSSIFGEFMTDMKRNSPAIIIDAGNRRLPPLDPAKRNRWQNADKDPKYTYAQDLFQPFFRFIEEKYTVIDAIKGYTIYKRK